MENPFFKEGDPLAYVVWYDNCEPYEDNYTTIDAIFSSWEEAERYIENTYGNNKNFKHERVKDYFYLNGFDRPFTAQSIDWTFEDSFENPRVTIEIWNLNTGERVFYDNKHVFLVEEK